MMKTIVITGSTRGIGYGLAEAFLARDCQVVISGRSQVSVDKAVSALSVHHPAERIFGYACDVAKFDQVQALWDAAISRFGRVDIWINNAGISSESIPMWEQSADTLQGIVDTNLTGTIFGCKVAIQGMIKQGDGHVYTMEGLGSGGELRNGNTPYGSTKYAIRYLTKALAKEAEGTPIKVSTISPGIVTTDLLLGLIPEERAEQTKRIFNILADKVETVAPWIADRVLENNIAGTRIAWLTRAKIFRRFLTARFNKRDLFTEA